MPSRLQKLCDTVMEAAWLTALVVTPLFFNVYSNRVFEPDKISLLRSLALVAIVAWIVKKLETMRLGGQGEGGGASADVRVPPLWRQPLVLLVLALAAAYGLSTALSITPRQSFWGSYQRLQGTFSMYSYMLLFVVVLDTLRTRAQWQRLQYAVIFTSLPIALYGILQHYFLDPLPWGGDTSERIAANMGNSIFVAAYLIMAVPLTLERLIDAARRMLLDEEGNTADALTAGTLLFVVVVQFIAIIFSQSRGPWLGIAAGAYVFFLLGLTSLRQRAANQGRLTLSEVARGVGMGAAGLALVGLGLVAVLRLPGIFGLVVLALTVLGALALYLVPLFTRKGWRWLWLSLLTQAVVMGALLVALNLPNTPLATFERLPYVGRLAQLMETESGTGRVRVLIWEGVIQMLRPHPPLTYPDGATDAFNPVRLAVGYGPESMWVAYPRFYLPELGGLESRNASPDRSHNETFDSLAITGVAGFMAYILLFGGVFYYALKWLGLVRSRWDRIIFIILGLAGGIAGVLIPWLTGYAHLLGVGIPLGFVLGVLVYITYAAFKGAGEALPIDRRQLLIAALLATVVAHFVEIHFGISIAATRTYFFVFVAAMIALGVGALQLADVSEPKPETVPMTRSSKDRRRTSRRSSESVVVAAKSQPFWQRFLPYAVIAALVFLVLDWNFVSNQKQDSNMLVIFAQSWITHLNVNKQLVSGPGALWVALFTGLIGFLLAVGETWSARFRRNDLLTGLGIYAGATLATWIIYGLYQASRLAPQSATLSVIARATHIAGHVTAFYVWLGLVVALLAAALWVDYPRSARRFTYQPAAAAVGVVLLAGVFFIIGAVNLRLVRADVFFKLGQGSDAQRQWQTSLAFYDEATKLSPREDHYQLFRGRALLERTRNESDENLRVGYLTQAEQALLRARALNPLNTDHSANLARFYVTKSGTLTDAAERQKTLRQASDLYAQATALSPNTAHLQDEWAGVYMQLEEYDKAREKLDYSLQLDPRYFDTYLRLGQLEGDLKNWEASLAAYTRAAELAPRDARAHSGRGFALAQLGRITEAITANQDTLAVTPNDVSSLRNLAILYRQKGDLQQALDYAMQARAASSAETQASLDAFIQDIRNQLGEG